MLPFHEIFYLYVFASFRELFRFHEDICTFAMIEIGVSTKTRRHGILALQQPN